MGRDREPTSALLSVRLSPAARGLRRGLIALPVFLSMAAMSPRPVAQAADGHDKTRRVLMLYPYSNLFQVSVITGEAARKRLIARSPDRLEFYTDFLDLG